MKWHGANKKKYIEKGYTFTKIGDIFYAKAIDVLKCSKGVKLPVICDYCGRIFYPTANNYLKVKERGELDCCTVCNGKMKEKLLSKYGVDNPTLVSEIREKQINTCVEKYGTRTPLECEEIYNKTVQSLNNHYNVNGIAELRNIPEIIEKTRETNRKKFGGNAPLCSEEIRAKVSKTMWENGTCKTSLKQIELFNFIKEHYGNCELNYPCDKLSLDCMVVIKDVKIDIEYDGWYWHQNTKEQDKRRDYFVESKGYKVLRILAYKNRMPTIEELNEAINYLLTTNNKFSRIELR